MKKTMLLVSTFIISINGIAQNVGIGTTVPAAKLHINHKATSSSPTIRLFDSTAGTGSSILFAKEGHSNSFSVVSTIGTFAANNTLDFRTTFNSGILLRGDGRIGINNVPNPIATLQVGGGMKVNDTLNVGNSINIEGEFKINGNPGTSGQVLVSTGSGLNPEWRAGSFPASERAWILCNTTNLVCCGFADTLDLSTITYNTSTASINTSTNMITINKTGLYRFQGIFSVVVGSYPTVTGSYPEARLILRQQPFQPEIYLVDMPVYDFGLLPLRSRYQFNIDIYITAGTALIFFGDINNFNTAAGGASIAGNGETYISFYMISE